MMINTFNLTFKLSRRNKIKYLNISLNSLEAAGVDPENFQGGGVYNKIYNIICIYVMISYFFFI